MADREDRMAEANRLLAEGFPGPLKEAANFFHEVYTNLKEAGFTEKQALWIVGYCMSGGANISDEGDT